MGLISVTVMGSISVAGAPGRHTHPVMHGGHARPVHLSSVSASIPSPEEHPAPTTITMADKLRRAFAAFYHIAPRDVGAIVAGSLHVAADPAQKTFWATAEFPPSGYATPRVAIDFQDGGDIGIFLSPNDISWHMTGVGGEPFPCPTRVPSGILAVWGLAPSPLCSNRAQHSKASPPPIRLAAPNAPVGTIAQVAESQVGVGDTPVSRSFSSPDCNPYTALVGERPGSAGCGVDPRFNVLDQNEFWCADFAKWVWGQAGVRSDLGTLNPGAASFYTWALEHGQQPRFGSDTPAVGDAVVFYPPWDSAPTGSWADHVGIVVGVNSNGTVDLVNGDFGGDGTPITVEQNNDISLASWASEVWNSGEKWIFVSPGAVSAPPPRLPAISSFAASPSSLPGAGGLVTLAVSASNATSYSFTSSPPGPAGLAPVQSDSGQASDTVTVPLNATGQPVSYTFTVTATGPAGSASAAVSVTASSLVSGGYATPRYGVPGQTDVFGVTPSGALTVRSATGRGGWTTAALTAAGFAPPGAAIATSPQYGVADQTDVFVTGSNGAVDLLWANGEGAWHSGAISGPGFAPPGAVVATSPQYGVAGQTDVFVTGTNGAVDLLWASGDRAWHSMPVSAPGLARPGAAVATSPQYGVAGQTDVFVTGANGAVDLLSSSGQGIWHSMPVSAPGLAPRGAAIATSPQYGVADQTDVFVTGSNGAVNLLWASGEGTWHSMPVSAPGLARPGAAVATSPQYGLAGQTDVLVTGANGAVDLLWAGGEGAWRSRVLSAPGLAPRGAAIATSPQYGVADQTDVFVTGSNGAVNLLWASGQGTWHSKPI
jgi:hypothetical protein